MKKIYITVFMLLMVGFVVTAVVNADDYKEKLNEEVAINFLETNGCTKIDGKPRKVEEGFVVKCEHEFSAIFGIESREYILLYTADPKKPYLRDVYTSN